MIVLNFNDEGEIVVKLTHEDAREILADLRDADNGNLREETDELKRVLEEAV